jgi:hypothetical protein
MPILAAAGLLAAVLIALDLLTAPKCGPTR